jgi:hypothetical protein
MIRTAATLVFLLAAATAAFAASARKLAGFAGLNFGTSYEAAEKKLGEEATADTDPTNSKVKILQKAAELYGEPFVVNFRFADDRMSEAYAIAKVTKSEPGACRDRWEAVRENIEKAHGKPAAEQKRLNAPVQLHDVEYEFANGAKLEASLLGCLIQITATAPPPKDPA